MPRPGQPGARPRLRGSLHYWSFYVSLATGGTLITLAGATVSGLAALATSVYVATVLGLFGVSALYHRHTSVNPRPRVWMKILAHPSVFLLIAHHSAPFPWL